MRTQNITTYILGKNAVMKIGICVTSSYCNRVQNARMITAVCSIISIIQLAKRQPSEYDISMLFLKECRHLGVRE
jgi:hypothetical protein